MAKQVILLGAGGHAKVIADIVRVSGDAVVGVYDDALSKGSTVCGVPVLGTIKELFAPQPDREYIIAIGNNAVRKMLAERFENFPFYTAIHPSAQIGTGVVIGKGTCVMPLAIVNAESIIGEHVILNSRCTVEHENKIGDFVHLAPGSVLCGNVSVGENSMLGAGVVVKNNISIGENCVIGAGATVVKNIEKAGTYVGTPARRVV